MNGSLLSQGEDQQSPREQRASETDWTPYLVSNSNVKIGYAIFNKAQQVLSLGLYSIDFCVCDSHMLMHRRSVCRAMAS